MVEDLARRTDRALRTSSARDAATGAYEALRRAPEEPDLLTALASRRCWHRRGEREFACTFGGRTATLTVPRPFDGAQMARLITRVEVNVFLGDSDPILLRELQGMAQRELERLLEDEG
ncbi:MAG TPA: hypothetical protein VEK57_29405 [Thermoanaerobaculia bacterium]|nr:hypothetical protein [Thermoanaerobaculia bacterium]